MPDQGMTGLLSRMADFLAYVTKPDGRLAPIGDTDWYHEINPGDPVVAEYAARSNLLCFVLSGGNEGTPGEPFKVYAHEGYAFFRDDWLPDAGFENAVYILFTAAANPRRGHKHQDDLSFVLSAHGYDMLVDPGRHSYNYGDPGRQYVVRPEAHNTVAVDRSHSRDYSAEIVAHGAGDGFAWVSGRHRDFDGIEHLRTLVHLRPSTLLVIDHLRPTGAEIGARSNRFFQVLHLADDAMVERSGDGAVQAHFSAVSSPPATLSIVQLDRKPAVRLEIVRGQTKPMQGWIAKESRQLTPAPVVVSEKRGLAARFVTLLRIGRGDDVAGGRVPETMWETQSGIETRLPWDEREGVVPMARNGVRGHGVRGQVLYCDKSTNRLILT